MIKVAILGDIGSGKTFVSNKFGYPVFNADKEVANIYKKNKACFLRLKKKFPKFINTYPIDKNELNSLVSYCKELNLNLVGLMCIPPAHLEPDSFFEEMKMLKQNLGLSELSMGMSSDFLIAAKNLSTYIRVGSSIFGQRS